MTDYNFRASNPVLGLSGFQPPKQNYADHKDIQNCKLHWRSPFGLFRSERVRPGLGVSAEPRVP
jgi:hypothetical protein